MTEKIYFPQPILPGTQSGRTVKKEVFDSTSSFEEILAQKSLKFSRHAKERLAKREITLEETHLQKISAAVDKAAAKGSRDSLILVDNMAFVVSIKNRTIITALDESSMKGNVFTNIDSAVII